MKNLILHLRLNISIVLAPIFLWGFLLSEKREWLVFFIGFFIFHVFLYGGSNAYNSYYDKDEGPIGGLKNPPKVTNGLLYFSLGIKILGQVIAFFINPYFAIVYFICLVLSIIYSHPKTRWKADPILSLFTVGFGQGGLAFISGWFTQGITITNIYIFIFGMLTTVFMSAGVYPLTQIYQIEEDEKRGDITFAVKYGVKKSFNFSVFCSLLSCFCMLTTIILKKMYLDVFLICMFYIVFIVQIVFWAKKYNAQEILANYSKIMKLNYANAIGFIFYIIFSFFRNII